MVMRSPGNRRSASRAIAAAALFCLPALALTMPAGLLPFAILMIASTLLQPKAVLAEARRIAAPLSSLVLLALGVVALVVASMHLSGQGWDAIDTRTRLLVLPCCALWAYALRVPRTALWLGALAGLAAACVLASWQVLGGAQRADGWSNAIVFADVVLVLMVLAAFCSPARRWAWTMGALLLGVACIVMSGSRGVVPGLASLAVVLALGYGWRTGRSRLLVIALMFTAATVLVLVVPALSEQTRVEELQQDLDRYELGDMDTSMGARLELLTIAGKTFLHHPLAGVGVGNFNQAIGDEPECRDGAKQQLCHLGHAHDDLAEWAATMGLPGILAIIALYGLPLGWFVRLIGAARLRRRPVGAAWAGAMVVAAYTLCGLTQSMFAHQLTAGLYAILVGILMGMALREARTPAATIAGQAERRGRGGGVARADDGLAAQRYDRRVVGWRSYSPVATCDARSRRYFR